MRYTKKITALIVCLTLFWALDYSLSVGMPGMEKAADGTADEAEYSRDFEKLLDLNRLIGRLGPWLSPAEVDQISYAVFLTSKKYNVSSELILAVMQTESSFNPRAVSNRGAVGLMQIMPSTGRWLAKDLDHLVVNDRAMYNPHVNVELGTYYISRLVEQFGDLDAALLAYNQGPNKLISSLRAGQSIRSSYPAKVKRNRENLR